MSEIAIKAQNISMSKAHKTSLKERFTNYMKEVVEFYGCLYAARYGYASDDQLKKFNLR